MKEIEPQLLEKRWVHSHEEDSDTEMVFRPDTYNFPRSRGRAAFELKPDHSLVESGIAPTDGPQISEGKWELSRDGKLSLYPKSSNKPSREMAIVATEDGWEED